MFDNIECIGTNSMFTDWICYGDEVHEGTSLLYAGDFEYGISNTIFGPEVYGDA